MSRSNIESKLDQRRGRRSRRRVLMTGTVVGIALVIAACGGSTETVAEPAAPIQLLDPTAFEQYLGDNPGIDLINVHIPYQGHIAGTDSFVDFTQILDYDGLPEDRNDPVVLYCQSGNMSSQAAAELATAGYTNIIDLDGGMKAWTASGRDLLLEEPAGG